MLHLDMMKEAFSLRFFNCDLIIYFCMYLSIFVATLFIVVLIELVI